MAGFASRSSLVSWASLASAESITWEQNEPMYNLPTMKDIIDIEGIKSTYYHSVPLSRGAGLTIAATPIDFQLFDSSSNNAPVAARL